MPRQRQRARVHEPSASGLPTLKSSVSAKSSVVISSKIALSSGATTNKGANAGLAIGAPGLSLRKRQPQRGTSSPSPNTPTNPLRERPVAMGRSQNERDRLRSSRRGLSCALHLCVRHIAVGNHHHWASNEFSPPCTSSVPPAAGPRRSDAKAPRQVSRIFRARAICASTFCVDRQLG